MVRNAQEVTNFGGIRGLRGLDDVKLYDISPPISEERWEPHGARNIEAVVLHSRGHLEFGQQLEYNGDFNHGGLEYVDRLNDDPSRYQTDPRRRTPIDFAPWGMHYFIARNGDIYKCMNEYDIAYGVEMKHIVGARESRIIGGRMKSKDLKGLDEGGFTDTSSEESETDEEGRVLNAGYYVYEKNGVFRKGDSFNFVRPSGIIPVIGVDSNGNSQDRRYVIMGREIVALERDGNSGKIDTSRSATMIANYNDVVALSVTDDNLFIYNKSGKVQKWERESGVSEKMPVNAHETIDFFAMNVSGFVHHRPENIVAGNYSDGKHYMVDDVQLRVFVINEFDKDNRNANLYVSEFRLQEANRHPSAIYVSGNNVFVYDRIDHQVYLYEKDGTARGTATYDLPITHSAYSSTIVLTDDRIYVVANAVSFTEEGLRNPHVLVIKVSQSAVGQILEQEGISLSQLTQESRNRISSNRPSDALEYSVIVHDIDWSIEPDEQFIRGTGSVTGVIEHLSEFVNNGIFALENAGKAPQYSRTGNPVVQKFLNLPNQDQIRIDYEHFSDAVRTGYEYSEFQKDLDTSDELIGRFIIRFGAGFGTIRYINPLYDIAKGKLSEALRIHTEDQQTGQGQSRLRPTSSDLGVVTIVGNFGDPEFNNEERRTEGFPSWFNRTRHRTWNNPTLNVMLDIRTIDVPNIQKTPIWKSLVSLVVNFRDRSFISEFNNQQILGHHQILSPYNDPGDSFPWGSLFDDAEDLKEENDEMDNYDEQPPAPEDENTRDPQYVFVQEEDGRRRLRTRRLFFEVGFIGEEENTFAVSSEDGLRIKFFVDYNLNSQPQASTIDIYNLSETTRETLREKAGFYRLYAGYEDDLLLLKTGLVAAVQNVWAPPQWVTTLLLVDPDYAKGVQHITRTWESKPFREIVEDIASAMGVSLDDTSHLINFNYPFTFTFSGPPRRALAKLLEYTDYSYSVEGGQLFINNKYKRQFQPQQFDFYDELYEREQLRREREASRSIAYVVSVKTGMIEKPRTTENGVDVKLRLTGGINVTDNIEIQSESIEGVYNVYGVTHTGDTWEGVFETRVKTMPIVGAPSNAAAQADPNNPNLAADAEFIAETEQEAEE